MMHWKEYLLSSLKVNIEKVGVSANYVGLATVRPDLTPAVRTVVMRGFLGEHHDYNTGYSSDLLCICTAKSSNKIKEIEHNKHVEINWYMNGTMEQFRLKGVAHILDNHAHLDTLQKHITQLPGNNTDTSRLEVQAFMKAPDIWTAERYRQFLGLSPEMRASYQRTVSALEVEGVDEHGRFVGSELLDQAFEQFVVLVIQVSSVTYWSPSTGTQLLLS